MDKGNHKPRGRMSAYAFFVREEHNKKHPDEFLGFSEFSSRCADRWKTMPEKEKTRFHKMQEKDKERYESEMANYKPSDKATKNKGGKRKITNEDPNVPKRAVSAFFWFSKYERSKVKETMQDATLIDVAKELGKRWNEASSDVRAKYDALAAKDKARYSEQMMSFKQRASNEDEDDSINEDEESSEDEDDSINEDEEDNDDDGDKSKTAGIKGIKRLAENFKQVFLDGRLTDAVLKVDSREFNVHRIVLVARSPVFASMFEHDLAEKKTNVVDIPDCTAESFEVFLHYLYSGSAETLCISNVYNVYYAADKYHVDDLKELCVEFMKRNLSVETFCDIIALSLHHGESKLQKAATQFFCKNVKKIIKTVQWQKYMKENSTQANELLIKALKA